MIELENELRAVLCNNPSRTAPYHNNAHMEHVWFLAKQLWATETIGRPTKQESLATLMVASLLHDWGHSAGEKSDVENIQNTRDQVRTILDSLSLNLRHDIRKDIDAAIFCTQFPFVNPPVTVVEKVLRDADLLYTFVVGDPRLVLEDLRREMEVMHKRPIGYREMLDGQVTFLKTAVLFTETGKQWWNLTSARYFKAMCEYATEVELRTGSEVPAKETRDGLPRYPY